MAKLAWKNFLLQIAESSGLLNMAQLTLRGLGQKVYILAYHRVDDLDHRYWLDSHLISATPRQFEEQMKLVAQRYHPITADDLLDAVNSGKTMPKDAVLVTFDDGYRDFLEVIFPACSQYGIRPLLFVPTSFVGGGTFWWDKVYQIIHFSRLKQIETPVGIYHLTTDDQKVSAYANLTHSLKFIPDEKLNEWIQPLYMSCVSSDLQQRQNTLTWAELKRLVSMGVSVACHTHTHPIMTQISLSEARRQVCMARDLLNKNLGQALPIFAFPDGKPFSFNQQLCDMLISEGYKVLLTLTQGRANIQAERRCAVLPRLSVWQSQSMPQFHMRLTGILGTQRIISGDNGRS